MDDLEFIDKVTRNIDGWLIDCAALLTQRLLGFQRDHHLLGPLLEIGVYRGKYLSILLQSALQTTDRVFGIDTFHIVPKEELLQNIRSLIPGGIDLLDVIEGKSTDCDAATLLRTMRGKPRFISVDGSHSYADVLHDLQLADRMLVEHGIVAVDDFLNPLTIEVNRAANAFMESKPHLAAFAFVTNKLFLARPSRAAQYHDIVEDFLQRDGITPQGETFRTRKGSWRGLIEQEFFGHKIMLAPQ